MEILFGLLVLALLFYFIVIRKGGFGFWRKAQKHPEVAYAYFVANESWRVEDGLNDDRQPSRQHGSWHGPFYLKVPSIGKTVRVYGKVGLYESSQAILDILLDAEP